MNAKTKLVVVNEHTLAYILPQQPTTAYILRASVLRGASKFDGVHCIGSMNNVRLASEQDFNDIGVVFNGYKNDPVHYEFAT